MLDKQQQKAAEQFQYLHDQIEAIKPDGLLGRLSNWFGLPILKPKSRDKLGLYLHGPAGRGKTMLMNHFFDRLATKRKLRAHFHDFMRNIHAEIFDFRQKQKHNGVNRGDPLPIIAASLARRYDVLCLDELLVEDIADAMILARLFTHLFERGVCFVTTSNTEARDLYKDGLNRALFLPFIDLLEKYLILFTLDNQQDYRRLKPDKEALEATIRGGGQYMSPASDINKQTMQKIWFDLTGLNLSEARSEILSHTGRTVTVKRAQGRCAWFDFDELFGEWLSANDYLAITERFSIIFINDIPNIKDNLITEGQRLITWLDITYDKQISLIMMAADQPDRLFYTQKLKGAARAASRLAGLEGGE